MAQVDAKTLTLRVSEALAKDVGRGIVRIDPKEVSWGQT